MSDDWTSLIAVLVYADHDPKKLLGYIFIKDNSHDYPMWKIVGGGKEEKENSIITAMRELKEETGIIVLAKEIVQVPRGHIWRGNHWSLLHAVCISESQAKKIHSNHPRNEGEVPKFFTLQEFEQLKEKKEFLVQHKEKMRFVESYFKEDFTIR